MRLIHLVRHARPVLAGTILGRTDPPLADSVVIAPAACTGYICCSPRLRARETAARMFPGAPLDIRDDLAERDFGEWDGLTWSEIEQGWPAGAASAVEDWFSATPPGGEPWPRFVARVTHFWDTAPRLESVAVVAHYGVNAVLAERAGLCQAAEFKQDYAQIISIQLPD